MTYAHYCSMLKKMNIKLQCIRVQILPEDTGLVVLPDRKVFPSGKMRIRYMCVFCFAVLLPFRAYCGKGAFDFEGGLAEWTKG